MSEASTALRSVDLFASMSSRSLDKLAERSRVTTWPAGKQLATEGDSGVGFHLIVAGTAEVVRHGGSTRTLGPGDYFGEISLIDGEPRSATVRALEELRTVSIASWEFGPLLDAEPQLTKALLLLMCRRLRVAQG